MYADFQLRTLNTFLGLAQFLELGKRLISGAAALFLCRLNQLIEMATVEKSNAIFDAGILLVDVARVRPHANYIALFSTGRPKHGIADIRTAHVGWIIQRVRHCG